MDPREEKSTNEELSTQLQTSIQNKDVKLLREILRKNKVVKDVLVRCKRLRSHQTQMFGYHDDAVDALQYAAYIGTLDALSALLRAGFHTDTRAPTTRWTPLHFAAFGGHLEVVERLVSEGGDVNDCPSKHGATPLHLAVRHPPLVTFLLRQGARTNALCRVPAEHGLLKVNNFLTPLGVGVEAGTVGAVRALLQHCVDFDQVCEARNMDTPPQVHHHGHPQPRLPSRGPHGNTRLTCYKIHRDTQSAETQGVTARPDALLGSWGYRSSGTQTHRLRRQN